MLRKFIVLVTFCWMLAGTYYFFSAMEWKTATVAVTGFIGFLIALANLKSNKSKSPSNNNSQKAKATQNSSIIQVGGNYQPAEKKKEDE